MIPTASTVGGHMWKISFISWIGLVMQAGRSRSLYNSPDAVNHRQKKGEREPHDQQLRHTNSKKITEGVATNVHNEQVGLKGHGVA
jgi:hypothetical protein